MKFLSHLSVLAAFVFALCTVSFAEEVNDAAAECAKELQQLQSKLNALENTDQDVQNRLTACNQGSDALKSDIASYQEQINQLGADKKALLSKLEAATSGAGEEVAALKAKVATLEKALKEPRASESKLAEELKELKSSLQSLQAQIESERKTHKTSVLELTNELNNSRQGLHMIAFERAKLYAGKFIEASTEFYNEHIKEQVQTGQTQAVELTAKAGRKFAYFYQEQFLPATEPVLVMAEPHIAKLTVLYDTHVKPSVDVVGIAQDHLATVQTLIPQYTSQAKHQFFEGRESAIRTLSQSDERIAPYSEDLVDWSIYSFGVFMLWFTWKPIMKLCFKLLSIGFYTSMIVTFFAALCVGGLTAFEAINKA